MNAKKTIFPALAFFAVMYPSQQSRQFAKVEEYGYSLAESLFITRNYSSSQYEYSRQYLYNKTLPEDKREAAQFYDRITEIILKKNKAEKGLENFIKEYPRSVFFQRAGLPLSDYYFSQKEFGKALETLNKINQYQLTEGENREYVLRLGYAKFMTGDTQGAIDALEEAYSNSKENDKHDIAYMLGHLYYKESKNDKALEYFNQIRNDKKYSSLLRPYYVQIYYRNREYDRAIEEGEEFLETPSSDEYKTEVYKIVGEGYFMKKNYAKAYDLLRRYISNQHPPSENDLYEMGFVAAQLGKYKEAVSYYNRLVHTKSPISQNAYYQLGNAYLMSGQKKEALSAFRSSYQMDYDPKVQQLAHEQYAKLSYDVGNPYDKVPWVIQEYIVKYPQSPHEKEMKELLIKYYLYSGNYKEMLRVIEMYPNLGLEMKKIKQEVSYLLGVKEYNKSDFSEARTYFEKSISTGVNKQIMLKARYGLAQTYYRLGDYVAAAREFEKLKGEDFSEKQQLSYDLGYAYFKQKDFVKAGTAFSEYLKNPKGEYKNDAELRLADIYYASNQLGEAIALYNKTTAGSDYSLYQRALALGASGNTKEKIESLKALLAQFPDTEYKEEALYEIATTYASEGDFTSSNLYLDRIISNGKDTDLVVNAKIYKAQNFVDMNKDRKAFEEFRKLANMYKNSAYADRIVYASKPLYVKTGNISDYENFAQSLGVKLKNKEMEDIHLSTAKNFFVKKDYKSAIPFYEKYLTSNPSGENFYQSQYELGESYYKSGNGNKALLVLHEVLKEQNPYQEEARTRISQLYLSQNQPEKAKSYLLDLYSSSNPSIKNYASVELMNLFADKEDLRSAEIYARAVLASPKSSESNIQLAKAVLARKLLSDGKLEEAQKAYGALEKSLNTKVAAEALYARAYLQSKAKSYRASNETIFRLASLYSSEEYWGAQSLLVLAENYIALKDKYQASYILNEIINNYADYPDVIKKAKELKKRISVN
ncbi:MAG: tetratricopeptide repeat protein [Bergeyella sp.]|nr:tetratricopeptide repeat protein [Bergeyella sp.]